MKELAPNQLNHADNLLHLTGRWRGTFYDHGHPRPKKPLVLLQKGVPLLLKSVRS